MAQKDQPERQNLAAEVSPAGGWNDLVEGFVAVMRQSLDTVLRARGGDPVIYQEVLRDDRVMTALQQRRLALIARPWTVEPGADDPASVAAADALRADLLRLGWDRITERMHYGIFWGWSVAELVWEPRSDEHGTRWTWSAIKVRKARRFGWASEGDGNRLRLRTMGNQLAGEAMPDKKFWTASFGEDADDYPYGLGLAHWLFWPVYFKRHGLKMWVQAVDKWAGPTGLGRFPANASEEEKRKLLQAVRALRTDAGVIIPEGTAIELLESVRAAGADQSTLYAAMDRAIAAIITGQATTIEAASNRAQTETHKDVRDELIQADADLIHASFNAGPLAWWMEFNFPGAVQPVVHRTLQDEADIGALAQTDRVLHDMGWSLTEDAVRERYGPYYQRRQAAAGARSGASPAASPVSFAEAATGGLGGIAGQLAQDHWEGLTMPRIRQVVAALDRASDLRAGLEEIENRDWGDPDPAAVDLIASATLQARVAGRVGLLLDEEGG